MDQIMLKKERHRKILKLVEDTGKAEVVSLANAFHVSQMTIRRDLNELEKRGYLERVHGGALLKRERRGDEAPVLERTHDMLETKIRIAQKVASLIKDGEKIFIGSGSTMMLVAEALSSHRNLTVYTNALNIVDALYHYPITVTVVGGTLRRSELSLIGPFTENCLRGLVVDKVIIGIRGIDPVKGLTSDHMEELITDQAILTLSKNVIVAADHTKLGHVAAIRTAPISAARKIVTSVGGPKDIIQAIRRMGIEVIEV
jgi:DeoR/GlpR family transcriptional regulator of sugar metabolism